MAFASRITSYDVRMMLNPITQRFTDLRARNRRALVCYLTAGHPDEARSVELLRGVAAAGADLIEVGIPFSDPLADGPVIQASSQQALAQGMTFDRALALIARAAVDVPVIVFSYLNPLLAAGPDALRRAADAGASGVLVTDLPVGADPPREAWFGDSHLGLHSSRCPDDAGRPDVGDRAPREWVRVSDQPSRCHRRSRGVAS